MDIRNAKRPVKGTRPSRMDTTTAPVSAPGTPTVNSDGTLNDPPEDFSMNSIMRESWTYLKEHGISETDLKSLLDSILTSGNAVWDFKLMDRIPVAFKIRDSWVDDLILDRLDDITREKGNISSLRYSNLVAEYNLAASILQFGEKKFTLTSIEDFDKNLEYIKSIAYVFRNRLIEKLAVFDRAVAIATSDWALKNFTTPLKED